MRVRAGFLCACALSLAVAMASPAAAQVSQQSTNLNLSTIRISNFGRVDDSYFRGAQPKSRDYGDLAALGVKTVIDLQGDGDNADEAELVTASGMRFYRIPMTPRVAPTQEQLATFLRIVNDPTQQPVYVHCAGGRHRTGVMTAVYRMEKDRWDAGQAFREMKKYDFGLDFLHPEFKKFVFAYQPQHDRMASVQNVTTEVASATER
jgi:protein tyrosine/serine phosphatase